MARAGVHQPTKVPSIRFLLGGMLLLLMLLNALNDIDLQVTTVSDI